MGAFRPADGPVTRLMRHGVVELSRDLEPYGARYTVRFAEGSVPPLELCARDVLGVDAAALEARVVQHVERFSPGRVERLLDTPRAWSLMRRYGVDRAAAAPRGVTFDFRPRVVTAGAGVAEDPPPPPLTVALPTDLLASDDGVLLDEIERRLRVHAEAKFYHPDGPPDLTATFVGVREWVVGAGAELRPTGNGGRHWNGAREVRATCVQGHPAPDAEHACGFNAWDSMWQARTSAHAFVPRFVPNPSVVVGAVAAWGVMAIHQDGFRAEYARPVAIGVGKVLDNGAERVAAELGLPAVPLLDLEDAALEHGERVPPELKPDPERAAREARERARALRASLR